MLVSNLCVFTVDVVELFSSYERMIGFSLLMIISYVGDIRRASKSVQLTEVGLKGLVSFITIRDLLNGLIIDCCCGMKRPLPQLQNAPTTRKKWVCVRL
jgi:hypothetical protein